MALDNIENLLEKYFEAQTTVAEEKALQAYFSSSNVAQHLEQYKPLFNYFTSSKTEQLSKNIPLKPKRKLNLKWLNVAAIVLFTGYFGYDYYIDYKREQLYNETKEALFFVSKNFNNGTKNLVHLTEIENTKKQIFK
jgi:hypothetical protein